MNQSNVNRITEFGNMHSAILYNSDIHFHPITHAARHGSRSRQIHRLQAGFSSEVQSDGTFFLGMDALCGLAAAHIRLSPLRGANRRAAILDAAVDTAAGGPGESGHAFRRVPVIPFH
jgi:hypothetical protein